jgi:peptide/nickel transport system permease protein
MREALYYARRYPLGVAGALILIAFVVTAVFANVIAPYDPLTTNARFSLAPPSRHFLIGADMMGRDMLSRMIHGARISLAVALGATCIGSGLGAILGLTSGYIGGWFDLIVQRIAEIMQALPLLVMALVITASLGPSLVNTIIAIAIPLIPNVARVIRANVLSLREVGMRGRRIALVHVFPNTIAPLIVLATAQLGSTILTEASLSFLGLGVPEPYPSWGRMLSDSAAEYLRSAPWLVIFPGVAISLVVFGANLFGDALRDILDPRQGD